MDHASNILTFTPSNTDLGTYTLTFDSYMIGYSDTWKYQLNSKLDVELIDECQLNDGYVPSLETPLSTNIQYIYGTIVLLPLGSALQEPNCGFLVGTLTADKFNPN